MDLTRDFYENTLGLKIYKDQGKCIIYTVEGFGKLGFCSHFPETQSNSSCITFVYDCIEDIDNMYNKFLDKSVSVEAKPERNEYFKIYHFFLVDPNGLKLEFQCFLN